MLLTTTGHHVKPITRRRRWDINRCECEYVLMRPRTRPRCCSSAERWPNGSACVWAVFAQYRGRFRYRIFSMWMRRLLLFPHLHTGTHWHGGKGRRTIGQYNYHLVKSCWSTKARQHQPHTVWLFCFLFVFSSVIFFDKQQCGNELNFAQ